MDPRLSDGMIEAARWAPSSHNTQPWRFAVGEHVELFSDRRRALPVNDPDDRELTISCGAALFNMRVGAASLGAATDVELCTGQGDGERMARVRVCSGAADRELAALAGLVRARHTTRAPFRPEAVDAGLLQQLENAAAAEGAALVVVDDNAREPVAALVARAGRMQFENARFREELAQWLRAQREGEGLSTFGALTPLVRPIIRGVDVGRIVSREDRKLARSAPLLVVLATEGDGPADWMRAGQALSRMLLVAAGVGVQAGFLNQPCQLYSPRGELRRVLGITQAPHILARFGVPRGRETPSSRRPISDLMLSN